MKKIHLTSLSLLALLFASCSSTPQSRINQNPNIYNSLTNKEQGLVSSGQITEGMTKPAVFLAMGRADKELVRVQKEKRIERWDYNTLQPVYHSGFSYHSGFRRGFYGGGFKRGFHSGGFRRGFYGGGFSSSISYIPSRGSSVYFEDEKVTGWEGVRR